MNEIVPSDPAEFDKVMSEIDQSLLSEGYDIPQRHFLAPGVFAEKYNLVLPAGEPVEGLLHESDKNWPITQRILEWYDSNYGERIKIDFNIARMVILIGGDLWKMKIPRGFGNVTFTISKDKESEKIAVNGKSAKYNVFDAIEGFPNSRKIAMSDGEMKVIHWKFILGLKAFSIIENTSPKNILMSHAFADINSAVMHLSQRPANFGMSKWSSLQASEKLFKAAIELEGENYIHTHDLSKLSRQAVNAGLLGPWDELISNIQCTPGIRYGDEECGRDSALLAHHASLELATMLKEGGAKFESGVSINLVPKSPKGACL